METRTCNVCGETKPLESFSADKRCKNGKRFSCKLCRNKRWGEYREEHFEQYRERELKRSFGITLEYYNALLKKQDGVCAVCGNINWGRSQLSVDHDHTTEKIRGLLCDKCNLAIGGLRDNPVLLRKAADYLEGKL